MSAGNSYPEEIYPKIYPEDHDKDEFQITKEELKQFKEAFKNEKFRKLLSEYVEEVQDPENQAAYQKEIRQLEQERGNTIHFINPLPGYVLKTSVNGDKKAFINICANPIIRKATFEMSTQDNQTGSLWSIPYAQSSARDDVDKSGTMCAVYDVIFHPTTLLFAQNNVKIREKLEDTAIEAVEKSYNVTVDKNNLRKPKLKYKGMANATIIKYKTGEKPPHVVDIDSISEEIPPQRREPTLHKDSSILNTKIEKSQKKQQEKPKDVDEHKKSSKDYTVPKYSLKFRCHVDMQDYCYDNQRYGSSSKPIPDEIRLITDLPMLKDSSTLDADVIEDGWHFELKSEGKVMYHLKLRLPFQVHCDTAKAVFDKDKRKLTVTMKTVQKNSTMNLYNDSGIENDIESSIAPQQSKEKEELQFEPREDFPSEKSEVDYDELDDPEDSTQEVFLNEKIPSWINGDVVVKSILKVSARSRSMSESWVDNMTSSSYSGSSKDCISLENLNESDEVLNQSQTSSGVEKSVRFNEAVQRQLYRSNSSILGQRKKNQRKSKNKRKVRERAYSEGSVSSMDDEDGLGGRPILKSQCMKSVHGSDTRDYDDIQ